MSQNVVRAWGRITEWLVSNFPEEAAQIAPPASHDAVVAVRSAVGGNLPADLVAWWGLQNGFTNTVSAIVIPPGFSPVSAEDALRSRDSWVEHWNGAPSTASRPTTPTISLHRAKIRSSPATTEATPKRPRSDPEATPKRPRSDPEAYAAYVEEHLCRPAGSACTLAFLPAWLPIADGASSGDLFIDLREGPEYGCVRWFERTGGAENGTRWPSISAMLMETAVWGYPKQHSRHEMCAPVIVRWAGGVRRRRSS